MIASVGRMWGEHRRAPTWSGVALCAAIIVGGLALAFLPLTWLAVALLAMVVGVLILIRPHLALYLIAFTIPFGSWREVDLGGITVGATEGLLGLMLLAWLAQRVARRDTHWAWPPLTLPLSLFIGAALLSVWNVVSLPLWAKELAKWVEMLAVITMIHNTLSPAQERTLVSCLLLAGAAQAGVGIYQFLARSGPDSFVLMGRFMRAYGSFEQPNPFAGYLGLLIPLAWALTLNGWPLSRETPVLPPLSLATMAAGLGMSWSRGGWLAFGAAFAAVNMARSKKAALLFAAAVILIAILGLLGSLQLIPPAITQRLTGFLPLTTIRDVRAVEINDENYAVLERLAHWQAAQDMWGDHLWLGVGFGNYQTVYPAYALPKWPLALGHAHNYYLNVAAETGLVGLLAYLVLWGAVLVQTVRSLRIAQRQRDTWKQALALGALGAWMHLSVHHLLDNLWVHNMYILVAMLWGLSGRAENNKESIH